MTRDVFQDHDGVVDHKSGGNGQRHQAQIIERETGQVHDGKGPHQRDRHRDRRDGGRPAIAQKNENDQYHQQGGDHQRALHLAQRGADGGASVQHHLHPDGCRNRGLQLRHQCLDPIHGLDDVGPGLPEKDEHHRRLPAHQAGIAEIERPVLDLGDIGYPDSGPLLVADDQGRIVAGLAGLVIGLNLPVRLVVFDKSLGAVGIGGSDGGPHRFHANAVMIELHGVELHPHRGLRPSADCDVADAVHLRQFLS